jgi:hypothetical protein
MAVEVIENEFKCLVDYFAREVAKEALIALRNVVILLKSLLELYLITNLGNLIDRQIEEALVNLRFDNPVTKAVNDAVRQVNEIRDLMPPDKIAECVGANKVLESVDLAMGVLLTFKSLSDSYLNRYRIVSFIESARQELFNRVLEYLDILVIIIDDALVKKVEEGLD